MAEIPSDIAASAAQAGHHARDIAEARDARSSPTQQGAGPRVNKIDEAGEVVETDDRDTEVYADAEGTGSQGRSFEEGEPEQQEGEGQTERGIITDESGQTHLDLEA